MQRIGHSFRLSLVAVSLLATSAGPAMGHKIKVTTTLDNDLASPKDCTLRDAITAANTDAKAGKCHAGKGADVIELGTGLTYVISVAGPNEDNNQTGDLDCYGPLEIDGNGSTIDGAALDRVLDARIPLSPASPTSLGISSLRITNGITPSTPAQTGGGIRLLAGVLRASHLTVDHCVSSGNGGGIAVLGTSGTDFYPASLHLDHALIESNSASHSGGGALCQSLTSASENTCVIEDSTIRDNEARAGGGISLAAFFDGKQSARIERSTISGNRAVGSPLTPGGFGGGGVNLQGSTDPGAVPDSLVASIDQCTIAGNTAVAIAGGVKNSSLAKLNLSNSTVSGNAVTPVGAIPQTGVGGGLSNQNGSSAVLANVSVSGNTATGNPAAQQGGGAGIINVGNQGPATLTLLNTTVTHNHGALGGGIATAGLAPTSVATTTFENTIVAGNTAAAPFLGPSCLRLGFAVHTTLGQNIEDKMDTAPNSCGAGCSTGCGFITPDDQINTNPLLGPLADNGGPTLTHALLDLSPAIGAGDDAACAAPPVNGIDQRGLPRPGGIGCDIGAFEVQ